MIINAVLHELLNQNFVQLEHQHGNFLLQHKISHFRFLHLRALETVNHVAHEHSLAVQSNNLDAENAKSHWTTSEKLS